MSKPDRIWTTGHDTSGSWNSQTASTKRITLDEKQYLASTPAREHAEKLAGMLKSVLRSLPAAYRTDARALLSKLDTQ